MRSRTLLLCTMFLGHVIGCGAPAQVAAPTDAESKRPGSVSPPKEVSRFVGARSEDMMVSPPPGLDIRGERILDDDDSSWGLLVGSADDRELLLLDQRSDRDFVIMATLLLPNDVPRELVGWDGCRVNGVGDSRVVAVLEKPPGQHLCSDRGLEARLAWRIEDGQFRSIPPEGVRCAPDAQCSDVETGDGFGVEVLGARWTDHSRSSRVPAHERTTLLSQHGFARNSCQPVVGEHASDCPACANNGPCCCSSGPAIDLCPGMP